MALSADFNFARTAHVAIILWALASPSCADVVVLYNDAADRVQVSLQSDLDLVDVSLGPGQSQPFSTRGKILLTLGDSRTAVGKRFPTKSLLPYSAYRLFYDQDQLQAQRIPLGGNELTRKPNPLGSVQATELAVPVSVWVDDEQPATRKIWQAKLSRRFTKAAAIVTAHSGISFRVERFGRWQSDNQIHSLIGSLHEFIDQVHPGDGLAIGFSSQHRRDASGGTTRIAGTRKPLSSHILVREWQGITEQERVELLAHELGHFLGACHSSDANSAMRATLCDRTTQGPMTIRFDPANTLVMSIVGYHLRNQISKSSKLSLDGFQHLDAQTRRRLSQIYWQLAFESPGDPVCTKYLELLR